MIVKKGWRGYDVKDSKERTARKGWHGKEDSKDGREEGTDFAG